MRNYVENPLVIDSVWSWYEQRNETIVGMCEACRCDITDSEDFVEFEDGSLHHNNSECLEKKEEE